MRHNTPNISRAQDSGNGYAANNALLNLSTELPPLPTASRDISSHTPTLDYITMSVRFNKHIPMALRHKKPERYRELLDKKFTAFLNLVASEANCKLQRIYTGGWRTEYYVPKHRVYIGKPNPQHGWASIRFQPNRANLCFLQKVLHLFFGRMLSEVVSLTRVELAYDFTAEGFTHDDYCALALRLGKSLWPKHGTNTYTTVITGKPKTVRFGEKNGACTVYIQGCPKRSRNKDTDELDKNTRAAMSTKIYPKSIIALQWFLRIEATLNKAKAKSLGIKLDLDNFVSLLDFPNTIEFARLYEFREADVAKFANKLCPKPTLKTLRRYLWSKKLKDYINAPYADQKRLMRCAANGDKNLGKHIDKATTKITFLDAANTPLPDNPKFSQRMGKGKLPSDSELGEVKLTGIWNRASEQAERKRPVQGKLPLKTGKQAKSGDSRPLRASQCECGSLPDADMPKNRSELAPGCFTLQNPIVCKGDGKRSRKIDFSEGIARWSELTFWDMPVPRAPIEASGCPNAAFSHAKSIVLQACVGYRVGQIFTAPC